jgi:Flp pilus assembly protein protease CpaA
VFLIGIGIASFQDLKRREVDNWLNLLLLFSGIGFLVFRAIFESSSNLIIFGIISFLIVFVLVNLFYYGRVFAGGDAKLLFAMFALFVGISLEKTLINIGLFILFLLLAGSAYGLVYSGILFVRDFKNVKKEFKKGFENIYLRYTVFAGIVLFALSYVNWFFFIPAIFFLLGPVLYVFAKSLEKEVMTSSVNASDLREGDWLVRDVRVGGKVVKAGWEGVSKKDLELLKKVKKKIKIKEGLPFVPAFFIAFILWWFRDFFIGLVL